MKILLPAVVVVLLFGCKPSHPTAGETSGAAAESRGEGQAGAGKTVPGGPGFPVNFDGQEAGKPPMGFAFAVTGSGAPGEWIVRAADDAPSASNVLAQEGADPTDFRFPVAVVEGGEFKDVRVDAKCKMISGSVDQACGLVLRYRDGDNYYVTRANALEDNVRLYRVLDGRRRQFASWSGKVTRGVWHELGFEAKGDLLSVYWDGVKVLEAHDSTFAEGGKVGMWTKADSVSQFDDFTAKDLAAREK